MDHIGMDLTGAMVLSVALPTLLVGRTHPPITHWPRPAQIPVVVRVRRYDDEVEHMRAGTTGFEHLGTTLRWAQSERYENEPRKANQGELTWKH